MSEHNSIAVILARGGSKRLPGKNLKKLAGKSLIARAVSASIASKCFDKVIVSTDEPLIRDEAILHGASAPFLRPKELSSDTASSVDALLHAVKYYLKNFDLTIDSVCLIQPTSPFLLSEHIRGACSQFYSKAFVSLSSMSKVKIPPEWMFTLDEQTSKAICEYPEMITKSTSDLEKRYAENGAIYIVRLDWLLNEKKLYDVDNHSAYIMTEIDSIDIDTKEDWQYAEFVLKV